MLDAADEQESIDTGLDMIRTDTEPAALLTYKDRFATPWAAPWRCTSANNRIRTPWESAESIQSFTAEPLEDFPLWYA